MGRPVCETRRPLNRLRASWVSSGSPCLRSVVRASACAASLLSCRGRSVAGFYVLGLLHRRLELLRSHQRNVLGLDDVARGSDEKVLSFRSHIIRKCLDDHSVELAARWEPIGCFHFAAEAFGQLRYLG